MSEGEKIRKTEEEGMCSFYYIRKCKSSESNATLFGILSGCTAMLEMHNCVSVFS